MLDERVDGRELAPMLVGHGQNILGGIVGELGACVVTLEVGKQPVITYFRLIFSQISSIMTVFYGSELDKTS